MENKFSFLRDEELMLYLKQGEALAFDELYVRYNKKLMGYFVRMLNFDREKAKDALQDVFLKIVEHPEMFDTNKIFRTWVFTLAYNICKNFYRKQTTITEAHTEILLTEPFSEDTFLNLAGNLDAAAFKNALQQALEDLSADKRNTFVLRYQEEYSLAEIAEIMQCSEGTVKSRLFYTHKILTEKLQSFKPVN